MNIDTGKTEEKLGRIKTLLTDIGELSKGINVVINAGQPLESKNIKAKAQSLIDKKVAEERKAQIEKNAASSVTSVMETQKRITKVTGKINGALASLQRGREVNIQTDVAKERLTEILSLLNRIKGASKMTLGLQMGSPGVGGMGNGGVVVSYSPEYRLPDRAQQRLQERLYNRMLSDGSQNVFQFNSRDITRFIQDVQPTYIEDLITVNALYRPTTLDIGATDDYVRYRWGEVVPVYDYGCYEATQSTYGIMVYQEQFMSIAHTLGGFDLGKTDLLRKAIGKKKADLMATLKADFITGAIANGCSDFEAEEIWHKIEVAGKYSFNRSHAAAYALTAYAGAWLKANYPSAFYTVALQWADDKEMPLLMSEMELCSTTHIVPPEINRSGLHFTTNYQTDEIFWSLSRIKMVGGKTVEYIVAERERNGNYTSIENFIHRVFRYKLKRYEYWDDPDNPEEVGRVPVNARHVKNMILAGCFDETERVDAVTERHALLERAAHELGFVLPEKDFPTELRDKHYFWSQQQIVVSGIGSIDYRRIFDNSEIKVQVKGKVSYMNLRDILSGDNEGKRVTVCATVTEFSECSYKDKVTGEKKRFGKLILQQNNDLMEYVCWTDFYLAHRTEIAALKDKVVILTAVIRYSDYKGANGLQTYKTSLLYSV